MKRLGVLTLTALLATAALQGAPAAAAGKITGITIAPSAKVHTGDWVTITVQGTGACRFRIDTAASFASGSGAGAFNRNDLPLTLLSSPASTYVVQVGKEGTFDVTAKGVAGLSYAERCDGQAKTTLTVLPPIQVEIYKRPDTTRAPQIRQQKPDLVCSVAAYKDEALTQAIPDAGSVSFSDGSSKVYFVVTLQNVGNASVDKSFEARVQFKYNTKVVANPGFTISPPVEVGQTPRTVTVMWRPVPTGSTTMEVTGNVDSKNQVAEASKANNQCKLTITTALVAPQPQATFAGALYAIYSNQRCVNCHGAVNQPLGNNHPTNSSNCTSCHTNPPGWKNTGAPSFVGKSAAALCELAKSPGHVKSNLTEWGFTGSIDDPAMVSLPAKAPTNIVPGGHAAFVQKWNAWASAGKPCS